MLRSSYIDIKRLEQRTVDQYLYVKNSLMNIIRLLEGQRLTNSLMYRMRTATDQLKTDLEDLIGASFIDGDDMKQPIGIRDDVRELKIGVEQTGVRIAKLEPKLQRQDGQILRLLEYSLISKGAEGTAEDFLKHNITDPIIVEFIIHKGNGLDNTHRRRRGPRLPPRQTRSAQHMIRAIVEYYSNWIKASISH